MPEPETTCWTVILAAAAGSAADREELARRYLGTVRAFLFARWRGSPLHNDIDDATQEVFIECFREGGAVEAVGAGRVTNFRPFLYGVIRNVARRYESRPARPTAPLQEIPSDDASQSQLFDRTWAQAIMVEATRLQAQLRRRGRPRSGPSRGTPATAVRGEPAHPGHRRALGNRRGAAAPCLCPGPTGVPGRAPRGRRLPSARHPGRNRTGSRVPLEGAFLNRHDLPRDHRVRTNDECLDPGDAEADP